MFIQPAEAGVYCPSSAIRIILSSVCIKRHFIVAKCLHKAGFVSIHATQFSWAKYESSLFKAAVCALSLTDSYKPRFHSFLKSENLILTPQ